MSFIPDILISRRGRLITGSAGHSLKLWSVVGVGEMKLPGEQYQMRGGGLTMEDEMNLDGLLIAAAFDDTMDLVKYCRQRFLCFVLEHVFIFHL